MSGGAHKQVDKVNIIGVIVIGICAAVLVYVSIAGLQAFYANDSSDVQTMADYGGQDNVAKSLKADQQRNITEPKSNGAKGTFTINVKDAMNIVLRDVKSDPSNLVPAIGRGDKPTALPIFGRPKAIPAPATTPPAGGAGAPPPLPGEGSGSAAPAAGSGSAAHP